MHMTLLWVNLVILFHIFIGVTKLFILRAQSSIHACSQSMLADVDECEYKYPP